MKPGAGGEVGGIEPINRLGLFCTALSYMESGSSGAILLRYQNVWTTTSCCSKECSLTCKKPLKIRGKPEILARSEQWAYSRAPYSILFAAVAAAHLDLSGSSITNTHARKPIVFLAAHVSFKSLADSTCDYPLRPEIFKKKSNCKGLTLVEISQNAG